MSMYGESKYVGDDFTITINMALMMFCHDMIKIFVTIGDFQNEILDIYLKGMLS